MKYLLLILTITTLASCEKDNETQSTLIGEWWWVEMFNPWEVIYTPETSNEEWTLTINESKIISPLINNDIIEETEFSDDPLEQIISEDLMLGFSNITFTIKSNTLSFSYECSDCHSSTFILKK